MKIRFSRKSISNKNAAPKTNLRRRIFQQNDFDLHRALFY